MSITIKEVQTKKELWSWVRFPNLLYKDNEFFVPFLENDEFDTFTKEKNPAYKFCDVRLFLAFRDDTEIVGRIAAIINYAYNEKWAANAMRFSRFDFIDDYEVSKKLFDAAVSWGKEHGIATIMGPLGFTDIDHEGMLVEGFEEINMSITFYNYPYYVEHMTRLGLIKDIDWIEYKISVPSEMNPSFERISRRLIEKKGFTHTIYTDRKTLLKDAVEAFNIIDIAYSKLYGTVPLTPGVIESAINSYIPFVNLDYVCTVRNSEGKMVAFGALIPSIAKALKRSNGKLFPLGFVRLLAALNGKNDTLEMLLVAVSPEYQMQGVPAILVTTLFKNLIKNGVKYCETGPMLETNTAVHSLWAPFEKKQHKRRRCYTKCI